jgi:CTP synthase (UTP-ammonia lyase)
MLETFKVGIIGDYDVTKPSQPAIDRALHHAAEAMGIKVAAAWLPTPAFLNTEALSALSQFDALWASSGSPYQSMDGALAAIRQVRLFGRPFLAT